MSDDPAERLEILVHSAAPTSKKEDDRLRAQALACLGFQPTKRTLLTDIAFTRKRLRSDKGVYNDAWKLQTRKSWDENSQSQEAVTKEQHSKVSQATKFTSEIGNFTPDGSLEVSECSVESSAIQGLLSQAANTGISPIILTPERQSPPRSKNLSHLPTPDENEPPSSYATSRFDSWESPPASIPNSQPSNNASPLPVIPSSEPSAALSPSEVEEKIELSNEPMFLTHSGLSFCYAPPPPPTSNSLAPLSPHFGSSLALSEYSLTSLDSASYPPSPRLPEFNPSPTLKSLVDGPYEFFSPHPPTSSNLPLITRQLREMTEVSGGRLMEKYQKLKKSQTRELRKWERGHWSADTSSWANPKAKIYFWGLLKDSVTNGRLGSVDVFLDGEEGALVRVYCFGGMAEHLWCALFVMSSRNLNNATWIDAGDNEVIKF